MNSHITFWRSQKDAKFGLQTSAKRHRQHPYIYYFIYYIYILCVYLYLFIFLNRGFEFAHYILRSPITGKALNLAFKLSANECEYEEESDRLEILYNGTCILSEERKKNGEGDQDGEGGEEGSEEGGDEDAEMEEVDDTGSKAKKVNRQAAFLYMVFFYIKF